MAQKDELDQAARAAATRYMGGLAWPTVLMGLGIPAAYVATPLLVVSGVIPLWLGLLLVVILTYAAYTVLHEAVHGSISGSDSSRRRLNEALGYLAAWVLMIPMTAHRHEHLAHHRNTNDAEEDPDHSVSDMTRSPWHFARAGCRVYLGQYRYYLQQRWQRAPTSQNVYFCLEIAAALLPRLAFLASGYWLEGAVLFGIGGVAGVALLMYLFAYIVHRPHESVGRYVDTSTILVPGPLGKVVTRLWLFQNYHSIHHLFPRVPFYRYADLYGEIEQVMAAKAAPVYRLGWRGLERTGSYQSAKAGPCTA